MLEPSLSLLQLTTRPRATSPLCTPCKLKKKDIWVFLEGTRRVQETNTCTRTRSNILRFIAFTRLE